MKIIDLGNGAVGIEPQGPADRIASMNVPTLRALGATEEAIASFSRYIASISGRGNLSTTSS